VERALRVDPHDAVALETRGLLAAAQHRPTSALRDVLVSALHQPVTGNSMMLRGVMLEQTNSLFLAIRAYADAMATDPRLEAECLFNLGNVHLRLGLWNAAVITYEKVLSIPDAIKSADLFLNMGVALTQLKQFDRARECLKKCLKLSPRNPHARMNLGVVYELKGNLKKALKNFNYAIDSMPLDVDLYAHRGHVFRLMGQYDGALKDFASVLVIDEARREGGGHLVR
jgi:tetratricopeptide (TPR) repeat protein